MKRIAVLATIFVLILAYMCIVWYLVPIDSHSAALSERPIIVKIFRGTPILHVLKLFYKPLLATLALGAVIATAMAFIKKLPSWVRLAIQVIIPAAALFYCNVFIIKRLHLGIPAIDYAEHTIVLNSSNPENLYLKYLQITAFDILVPLATALAVAIICEAVLVAIKKK